MSQKLEINSGMGDGQIPVAKDWYNVARIDDGLSLILERHVQPWMRCNMWLIHGRERDVLVDTGMGFRPLRMEVAALRDRPVHAVCTHSHFDHMGCACEFDVRLGHHREAEIFNAPDLDNSCARPWIAGNLLTALPHEGYRLDSYRLVSAPLTGYLDEGDVLELGNLALQVLHLPGHSPGSIALYEKKTKTLFSGDAIYDGELIDNAWHSDPNLFRESLHRLCELPIETVHAGHFGSFGHDRLIELVGRYLSGSGRIENIEDWRAEQQGRS
ncbi:MBL fold metallo-hydrolase [Aminobacter anthyllidis]|uniref:MBL fold metallo-hydrolase n=1 Tax=Aminobacter anthyllidis TaxID=1035067 RepID=A0A9X1AI75_9HYPH|nr:MBL fold metallo-hydrolase [Aminobacter anthyllidis]MBT1160003.1 MBL fold metallo-hydrolase [Aminobacter anthyllidis]